MTSVPLSSALGDYLGFALDRLGDGITVEDPTGALVYANESGARLTGFDSAEELLRTPVEEVWVAAGVGWPWPKRTLSAAPIMRYSDVR